MRATGTSTGRRQASTRAAAEPAVAGRSTLRAESSPGRRRAKGYPNRPRACLVRIEWRSDRRPGSPALWLGRTSDLPRVKQRCGNSRERVPPGNRVIPPAAWPRSHVDVSRAAVLAGYASRAAGAGVGPEFFERAGECLDVGVGE